MKRRGDPGNVAYPNVPAHLKNRNIYISGPVTALEAQGASLSEIRSMFEVDVRALRRAGWNPVPPPKLDQKVPWEEALAADLVGLSRCRSIFLRGGFLKSRGAMLELYVARALGFDEYYADPSEAVAADERHGHPRFYVLSDEEKHLHSKKNRDYAHGGRPLGNFERVARIVSNYPGFPIHTPAGVGVIFMLKQLDATMWNMSQGYAMKVEATPDRMADVSVYGKLIRIMLEEGAAPGNGEPGITPTTNSRLATTLPRTTKSPSY